MCGCYNDDRDVEFIKRFTELRFLNEDLDILTINDNCEYYVSAVIKIKTNKIDDFLHQNDSNAIECNEIDMYLDMFESKYKKHILNANYSCYITCNEKFWQLKLSKSGYIFLEIWY